MFARSITLYGKPANIDAGIKFTQNEVAPMVDRIPGSRGLSLLVDRETGNCIVTTSWASREAMNDSDAQLREIRDRGKDLISGTMQIDEWEIAVMHRSHHGECCRVSWLQGGIGAMTTTFRVAILPALEDMRGFCSASMLVNHDSGVACVTSTWESRAAMEASRAAAAELREQTAQDAGGDIVDVHEFDLAYAHLHVPEMA